MSTSSSFLSKMPDPIASKKNRCNFEECKTKLLLSDPSCKCAGRYCVMHRFSDDHKCSFDYRQAAGDILQKQLVKCSGVKLAEKI